MKIKYIKPIDFNPYLVNYYENQYYDIIEIEDRYVDLIVDKVKYFNELGKNPLGGTKEEHIAFKTIYLNAIKLYTKKILLPFITIKGINTTNSFCIKSKEDIQKEYGLIDEFSFRTTTHFINDFFDYTTYKREQLLKKLLND